MLGNVDVAGEVCLLARVRLTDVHSHKVCQAGEFGGHLAKLTELGHERRSGARAEVEDKWPALAGCAEERDSLPSGEVVHWGVGGGLTLQRFFGCILEAVQQLLLAVTFQSFVY